MIQNRYGQWYQIVLIWNTQKNHHHDYFLRCLYSGNLSFRILSSQTLSVEIIPSMVYSCHGGRHNAGVCVSSPGVRDGRNSFYRSTPRNTGGSVGPIHPKFQPENPLPASVDTRVHSLNQPHPWFSVGYTQCTHKPRSTPNTSQLYDIWIINP